ncbi:MAG: RuBisCO large subunit C-terminal-like domain-containing protein [Bacillota bacterium]
MFSFDAPTLELSGDRFGVVYTITGDEKEAYSKARDICLEQTVEFPGELLFPQGTIAGNIVGRIEEFEPYGENSYQFVISYAVETAAGEFTQLLNVIFGNISLKPGIRLERVLLTEPILQNFRGPRFGREGLRQLLGIEKRPLLFTALKPMGLPADELAELAYQFALGGIDIIKDDHGLSDQPFSPFARRVELCAGAVHRANRETGKRCIYVPNITASHGEIIRKARFAKELGAGGLLISPALTGFDAMRDVAEDDGIALPIFAHPAFAGSYVVSANSGISHYALFGQLNRLGGADGTVYPNFGGRFSFTLEECLNIAEGTKAPIGVLKTIFPCPAGGMSLESIPESVRVYGNDVILLVGGGLFKHGPDLVENCRYFNRLVDKLMVPGMT